MKTVLVTGGTRRLGAAIADRLVKDGWRVITSSHRADALADITVDLLSPSGAARLYSQAIALCGGEVPDALVNNAAIFEGDAQAIDKLNFEVPRSLTMLMAGREQGRARVVNIIDAQVLGSEAAKDTVYLQSKRRLLAETFKAAAMFSATLSVNAVLPGAVLPPDGFHLKAETIPGCRPTIADVASAVAFLLSTPSVSGVAIPVDGGAAAERLALEQADRL